MKLEFYGIERAAKEGWMILQDPPPLKCRKEDRKAYDRLLTNIRRMGAIIVGCRASAGSRVWVFGLPPGEADLGWLREQALKAGMLLPPGHPCFTFRWRGCEAITPHEKLMVHGDVIAYHIAQACKCKAAIVSRRKAMQAEVAAWRLYRDIVYKSTE